MLESTEDAESGGRLTRAEVNLAALRSNLAATRALVAPARVMAVVKANGYGHGIVPCARAFVEAGADCLGVAFLEEGIILRRAGVQVPILVFGGIGVEQAPVFIRNDLELTVPSLEKLRAVDAAAAALGRVARIHLKVDTGMERIGMHWYSARRLLEESVKCRHVEVAGIYSHLANADAEDLSHARLQLERFLDVTAFYEENHLPVPARHISNSGAILQLPEAALDMVRPGILLYGISPSSHCRLPDGVRPALALKSRVVYFKVVAAGNPVGYGSTWAPAVDSRVITVPVGYGDGYFRSLSNRGHVLVRGRRRPVAGRVCMDQIMVNLGPEGTAYNGDEVVLLGAQGDECITAVELAAWAGTIPYEILTHLNERVPRVYLNEA
jgi:alanine racemase